jgi:pimeloyl-ACP methyl ester carboxylesterase
MGTVGGLRTRRYHGLLIVATRPPGGRMLGLAAIDPILIIGDRRIPLAVHEWSSGAIDPNGHVHLESFQLDEGLPRWRWTIGDVAIEREIAMDHGRASIAVVHRVVRAPGPVSLELHPLCTWRDVHGERFAEGAPGVTVAADGFVFEDAYRVACTVLYSRSFQAKHAEFIEQQIRDRSRHPIDARAFQAQLAASRGHQVWDELPSIVAPTLVLHGSDDAVMPLANARLLSERIPGAVLDVFDGAGHLFFHEQPERTADAVTAFAAAQR